jgi:ParB family transcriptional regulator, chromosome partitioning protein
MGRALIPYTFEFTGDSPMHLKPGAQAVPVARILPRAEAPTRELRAIHVLTVAESIATLGLLEPPILDTQGRLLAGAHRVAAMFLLTAPDKQSLRSRFLGYTGYNEPAKSNKASDIGDLLKRASEIDPKDFHARYPGGKVPVYVIDIPRNDDALPLAIETAENSVRRQYTTDEVQKLAKRLRAAGYTQRDGRPKKGEKTVVAALEDILGRSDKQVRRLLKAGTQAKLEMSAWQQATTSLVRAAMRARRANEAEGAKGSDADEFLTAVDAILGTATGRRFLRRQAIRPKT